MTALDRPYMPVTVQRDAREVIATHLCNEERVYPAVVNGHFTIDKSGRAWRIIRGKSRVHE